MRTLKMDKGYDIIRNIGNNKTTFSQDINRETGITFSHIIQIVNELEKTKFIKKTADGRKQKLTLTDKGNKLYTALKQIDELMK